MVKFKNQSTGEVIACTGMWKNQGVKTPRKVFTFVEMVGHDIFDIEPCPVEFDGFTQDKFRQTWRAFKIMPPWSVCD